MNESAFFQDLAVLMAVVGLVSILCARFRAPKVIGYLLAGVLMSEHTWGGSFLADTKSISAIGQLGIVFLMFTLGLEFSAGEMKKVKHVAVPTALFDMLMMIWLGWTVGREWLGWSHVQSLFLGAAICDSATTLLAKTIEEMKWGSRGFVRFIFGTTICEDIFCVAVIALVTGVASGQGMSLLSIGTSLGGLLVFLISVLVLGLVWIPPLLNRVARFKDEEALLLTLLGCCFFVSFLAYRLDFSLAMGAFLVGILGASSEVGPRLHALAAPLRNMFAAVFFVTIGLLVDPLVCVKHLPAILGLSLLVILGKGLNCFVMSLLTGQKIKDAVQTGFGLAQIGEFAFLIAMIYMVRTGDTQSAMYQIVVGVSLITTLLNPVLLRVSDPVGEWCQTHLPARLSGGLAAYQDWLARFRTARVPSQVQRHLRSRLVWLCIIGVLNFCVAVVASTLSSLDWSRFSIFFNTHKSFFFCLAANLISLSMLAPAYGMARSLARDIATVLTGARPSKRWKVAVQHLVNWFTLACVMILAFTEIALLNINLQPREPFARLIIWAILLVTGLLGWKKFRQAGRSASYRFNEALTAERRRLKVSSKKTQPTLTLSVPSDFYQHARILTHSPAVGQTIKSLDVRAQTGASIVAVVRNEEVIRNPPAQWKFEIGDEIQVIGTNEQLLSLRRLLKIKD